MIHGIHHITAIASDPQRCVDFYTKILGLRLTKKSINQDQVEAYHLFFGDRLGMAGMDLTFFTFPSAIPGKKGVGEVSKIALAIDESALEFWKERLKNKNVDVAVSSRHGLPRLGFRDPDGLSLELVAVAHSEFTSGIDEVWSTEEISSDRAIGYFYSASLTVEDRRMIDPLLAILGYRLLSDTQECHVYTLPTGDRAVFLEVGVEESGFEAVQGSGSVHHIAFRVTDERSLQEARLYLAQSGVRVTQVIDRHYFKSVYFRTPSGILFELATDGPGFAVDEDEEHLGERLSIPPFLEDKREYIESLLVPIKL